MSKHEQLLCFNQLTCSLQLQRLLHLPHRSRSRKPRRRREIPTHQRILVQPLQIRPNLPPNQLHRRHRLRRILPTSALEPNLGFPRPARMLQHRQFHLLNLLLTSQRRRNLRVLDLGVFLLRPPRPSPPHQHDGRPGDFRPKIGLHAR